MNTPRASRSQRSPLALRTAVALGTFSLTGAASFAQTFTPIPLPAGATSARATAISHDGTTIVGIVQTAAGPRGFSWSDAAGVQILPLLPQWSGAEARAVSGDGTMIVGMAQTAVGRRPALWSTRPGMPPGGGVQQLPLTPGQTEAEAWGISADGDIVVGGTLPGYGFRWTVGGGAEPLPPIRPLGISADGGVVIGWRNLSGAYWAGAGVVELSQPPSLPNQYAYAKAASADGSVIVGAQHLFGVPAAIRWDVDVATGVYVWKWLEETRPSVPFAVSASGSIVAGQIDDTGGRDEAVLWSDASRVLNIREYLISTGQTLSGWTLETASGISADGRTIAGWGENSGVEQAWVATIPPRAFCYANCDNSEVEPILNIDDFTCFINEFAAAQLLPIPQQITHYANCDGGINPVPIVNVDDFTCFINQFAAGCP